MRKIANADELERELRRLLAYVESERPSRARIASELGKLSDRVANSGQDIFYQLVPADDATDLYDRLEAEDSQSAELFHDVITAIQKELKISDGAEHALSRIIGCIRNRRSWDIALLRNNVFKAANSIGIRLPSGMF